ncbi:MAG: hypothetical protein HXL38_03270 [Candidatus Saccharimonas sp.]|nr:MAG: hypothetical protein HXL38_03270 [Candidatus Saccharimonas sp.]
MEKENQQALGVISTEETKYKQRKPNSVQAQCCQKVKLHKFTKTGGKAQLLRPRKYSGCKFRKILEQ